MSRCRSMAARVAAASTLARSIRSPSGMMPFFPMLISTRIRFGAAFATATDLVDADPPRASRRRRATSRRRPGTAPGSSFSRPACVWMSIRPGHDELAARVDRFRALDGAMFGCTAAIFRRCIGDVADLSSNLSRRVDDAAARDHQVVLGGAQFGKAAAVARRRRGGGDGENTGGL